MLGTGNFFYADVMVVIVEGGKQDSHQKEGGLGFACYYLVVEVVGFLGSVAFVDYGSDRFDRGNWDARFARCFGPS